MSDTRIADALQVAYREIRGIANGENTLYFIKEKDLLKKFQQGGSGQFAGIKEYDFKDIEDLVVAQGLGIMFSSGDVDMNGKIVTQATLVMDIIDIVESGLLPFYRDVMLLVNRSSIVKPVQIQRMGKDNIYVVPGEFDGKQKYGLENYEILIWELEEFIKTGR